MSALAGLMLLAAACSTAADPEVASLAEVQAQAAEDDVPEEVDREQALLAFAECLREEGVDVADPEMGSEGELIMPRPESLDSANRESFRDARDTCSGHLEGVTLGFAERDSTEVQDMLLEYAACMRNNGWDMPDPDPSGVQPGSGQGGPFQGLGDREDPAFIAADETCRSVFGDDGPFRGRGGGG